MKCKLNHREATLSKIHLVGVKIAVCVAWLEQPGDLEGAGQHLVLHRHRVHLTVVNSRI